MFDILLKDSKNKPVPDLETPTGQKMGLKPKNNNLHMGERKQFVTL